MTSILLMFNDLLRKSSSLWYGISIVFILAMVSRLLPLVTRDMYVVYFVDLGTFVFSILVCVFIMLRVIGTLFMGGAVLKHEVLFYRGIGLGLLTQFTARSVIIAAMFSLLYVMASFTMWSLDMRYLLMGLSLSMFFTMVRTVSIRLNIGQVYYLGVVLALISLLYPMYILPNAAYVARASSASVSWYLFTYSLLYFLVGFKFFQSAWRKECFGWM